MSDNPSCAPPGRAKVACLAFRGLAFAAAVALWLQVATTVFRTGLTTLALGLVVAAALSAFPRVPLLVAIIACSVLAWFEPAVGIAAGVRAAMILAVAACMGELTYPGVRAGVRRAERSIRATLLGRFAGLRDDSLRPSPRLDELGLLDVTDQLAERLLKGWADLRLGATALDALRFVYGRRVEVAGRRAQRQRAQEEDASSLTTPWEIGDDSPWEASMYVSLLARMSSVWLVAGAVWLCTTVVVVSGASADRIASGPWRTAAEIAWVPIILRLGHGSRPSSLLGFLYSPLYRGPQAVGAILSLGMALLLGSVAATLLLLPAWALLVPLAIGLSTREAYLYLEARPDLWDAGPKLPWRALPSAGGLGRLWSLSRLRGIRPSELRPRDTVRLTALVDQCERKGARELASWARARRARALVNAGELDAALRDRRELEQARGGESATRLIDAEAAYVMGALEVMRGSAALAATLLLEAADAWSDCEAWHLAAVAEAEAIPHLARSGDIDTGLVAFGRALPVLSAALDVRGVAFAATGMSRALRTEGRLSEAEKTIRATIGLISELLERATKTSERRYVAEYTRCQIELGMCHVAQGRRPLEEEHTISAFLGVLELGSLDAITKAESRIVAARQLLHDGNEELAVEHAANAVWELEALRGTQRDAALRAGLLSYAAEVYGRAFEVLLHAAVEGHQKAAGALLLGFEAMERNGLALVLQQGLLDVEMGATGSERGANPDTGTGRRAKHDGPQFVVDDLRASLRRIFEGGVVDAFPNVEDLRNRLSGREGLWLRVISQSGGHVLGATLHLGATGRIAVRKWEFRDPSEGSASATMHAVLEADEGLWFGEWRHAWSSLTEAILPDDLIGRIRAGDGMRELVCVADSALQAFPFGALISEGRSVLDAFRVVVVPSLGVLGAQGDRHEAVETDRAIIFLADWITGGSGEDGVAEVAPIIEDSGGRRQLIESAESVIDGLRTPGKCGLVYIAGHGAATGGGLGHAVWLGERPLTAAEALTLYWPPYVVFASCWVGRMSAARGREPFGLPMACMLRGAKMVVAGIAPIGSEATARVMAHFLQGLRDGESVPEALRAAQLDFLQEDPSASLAEWAGLQVLGR